LKTGAGRRATKEKIKKREEKTKKGY